MNEATPSKKQQYERFKTLFALSRQRYLENGGDPRCTNGSLHQNEYLTPEERQELFSLGRQLSGMEIREGWVHCQGRSWQLDKPSSSSQEIQG